MRTTPPDLPALRRDYLQAMRQVASSVAIVTSARPEGAIGMTATALCSLSADPPALIVCVNQSASLRAALDVGEAFAVNLLAEGQGELAHRFGGGAHGAARFDAGCWRDDECAPYLDDAMCSLFCRVADLHAFGTHAIVVGRVDRVRHARTAGPLLYTNGRFTAVAAAQPKG